MGGDLDTAPSTRRGPGGPPSEGLEKTPSMASLVSNQPTRSCVPLPSPRRARARTGGALVTATVVLAVFVLPGLLEAQPTAAATSRPTQARPAPGSLSDTRALAGWWDASHTTFPAPPLITHSLVVERLRALNESDPRFFPLEEIGRSVENRPLLAVTVGRGPTHVLLWSQMHGDEPTATPALFDLLELLRVHRDAPPVARVLDALTLTIVPMLNPDGAERFERRNAQSIDVNRDALRLQTPEGHALKALRDRLSPAVGFNLHNQGWRTSLGDPPQPASISLLSVAFDKPLTDSPGRQLTRRLCVVIRDAIEPLAGTRIGRYSDEFEARAFGDNITRWGTPVVLIETGAWPGPDPDPPLVRINFVAIAAALDALATGRVAEADPQGYEALPLNDDRLLHTIIRNVTIVAGTGVPPFTGDVGVVAQRIVRGVDGLRRLGLLARIDDIGDLRTMGALDVVDGTGLTLAPLFLPGASPGQEVTLPDWTAVAPSPQTITVGQPAWFLLLRPIPATGALEDLATVRRYRVERVIAIGEPDAGRRP